MRSDGPGPLPGPLTTGGTEGPAHITRLARAAPAAQVLCEALWEALHDELNAGPWQEAGHGASLARVAALAERVADVTTALALLASADARAVVSSSPPAADAAWTAASAEQPPPQAPADAVLVDEQDEAGGEPVHQSEVLAADGRERLPAGIGLIETALERFERDQTPFAVLLVEVLGVERVQRGVRLAEVPHLMRQVEGVATRALEAIGPRSAAALALERHDRLWLCVPETERVEAEELVERVADALGDVGAPAGSTDPAERYFAALSQHSSPPRRQNGVQLRLAIGAAICPEDGRDASALVSCASVELAARSGVRRPSVSLADRT